MPQPELADDGQRLRLARLEAHRLVRLDHAGVAAEERVGADLVVLLQVVDGEHHVADRRRAGAGLRRRGRRPVDLLPADAAGGVGRRHRLHRDFLRVAAALDEIAAARPEVAAGRPLVGQGEVARNGDQRPPGPVGAGERDRAEEPLGVGMAHLVEDLGDRPGLHRLARVHHADPVAGLQHQPEVVADEEHRGAELAPEILDQLHDPGLDGHVERRRRLVEDQERRLRHQRHGDDDALLLPARELVRVAAEDPLRIRQPHRLDHAQRLGAGGRRARPLVDHRHFHELPVDLHGRVEARHRLLVDHRDLGAADPAQLGVRHGGELAPLEADRSGDDPPRLAEIAHHRQRHRRLAAARLADEPERLAGRDRRGEVHHRRDFRQAGEEGDRQVLDREKWLRLHGLRLPSYSVAHRLLPERVREQVQPEHQAHDRERRRQGRVDIDAEELAALVDRRAPVRALRADAEAEEAEGAEEDRGVADPQARIDDQRPARRSAGSPTS